MMTGENPFCFRRWHVWVLAAWFAFAPLVRSQTIGLRTNSDSTITISNGLAFVRFETDQGEILEMRGATGPSFVSGSVSGKGYMNLDANLSVTTNGATSNLFTFPGPLTYSVVTNTASEVEVKLRNTNFGKPSGWSAGALDAEIHYRMTTNDPGFYTYTILRHGPGYPQTGLAQMRMIIRTSDLFNWHYSSARENGVSQPAAWMTNAIYDSAWVQPKTNTFPVRTFTNGIFTNINYSVTNAMFGRDKSNTVAVFSKYDWSEILENHTVQGVVNETNGLWMMWPSREYFNGGPTHQTIQLYSEMWEVQGGHSGGASISLDADETWEKVFGPYFVCMTTGTNHAQQYQAALARAAQEVTAWPYSWVKESETTFPHTRGTVSGKLTIATGQTTSNALMVLAPDAGTYWQLQSKGYEFWTRADSNGNFSIPKVRPGTYTLFARVPGMFQEFEQDGVVVTAGATTNLGTISWNPPRYQQALWRVGTPDLFTSEFRFGTSFKRFGACWDYMDERGTNDLNFNPATSNALTDWYYAQPICAYSTSPTNGYYFAPKWNVNFTLTNAPPSPATLQVDLAGAINSAFYVYVNGVNVTPNTSTGIYTTDDSSLDRDSMQCGLHQHYEVPFSTSLLNVGTNQISITLRAPGSTGQWTNSFWPTYYGGVLYDAIELDAGPLVSLTWVGDGAANIWDNGTTRNFNDGTAGVPFSSGYGILFDNTGSSSPNINLTGTLQPGTVTINSGKDYTFAGGGTLQGSLSLNKAGTGALIINNTNSYAGNTTVSNGTLLVNGAVSNSTFNIYTGTLGGGGIIAGDVFLNQSGAKLAPGAAQAASTLTIASIITTTNYTDADGVLVTGTIVNTNDLTLTNADLYFDLASNTTPGSGVNDLVQLTGGTLTLGGTNYVHLYFLNGSLANGTYTLITGGGATVGGATNLSLVLTTNSARQTFALDVSTPGSLLLNVSGGPGASLVWRGTNGNVFDVSTTTNWLNGSAAEKFYTLDAVRFDDTATTTNINISGAPIPSALIVSNTARNYTFTNGGISGDALVIKTGPGSLTLSSTSNNWTGGTTISGGTVTINNGATFGSGAITMAGGTLTSGYNSSTTLGLPQNITVATGTTNTLNLSQRTEPSGTWTGGGTLNLVAPSTTGGTRDYLRGSCSQFAGTLNISGGGKLDLKYNGNPFDGFDNASVTITNETVDTWNYSSGNTLNIGALAGNSTAHLQGAEAGGATSISIGALNLSTTFAGVIEDSVSKANLAKVGVGTLTLSGTNTYSGTTTITAGTLAIGAGGTSGTVGTNTIANNGTLLFNRSDSITNNSVISGGGALVKQGAGTLTLGGADTYLGATTISAGTLALAGSIGSSSAIKVAAGAKLDVSAVAFTLNGGQTLSGGGVITGNVATASGAVIAPGAGGAATLSFSNNLTLVSGVTNYFDVTNSTAIGGGTNDLVVVAGNLALGGRVGVSVLGTNALARGSYRLFNVSGAKSGAFDSTPFFFVSGGAVGAAGLDTATAGQVNLVVSNSAPVANADYFSQPLGSTLKIKIADLLTNDTDADGDALSLLGYSATTTNGKAVTSDATYLYLPTNSVNDRFSYTNTDSFGGSASAFVFISTNTSARAKIISGAWLGGTVVVSFQGVAGYPYQVQRATNIQFNAGLRTVATTNAPAGGQFGVTDDFSDLGAAPSQAFYRLLYIP